MACFQGGGAWPVACVNFVVSSADWGGLGATSPGRLLMGMGVTRVVRKGSPRAAAQSSTCCA